MKTDDQAVEMSDAAQPWRPPPERDAKAHGHARQAGVAGTPPRLEALAMAALAGKAVPERRWVAEGWIPDGKAVLLAGAGAVGKTTLALQLGAARAVGLPFLGLTVVRGRTLALLCEEDGDDAHRALARLAGHFGRELNEFGDLLYLPRAGEDNALVARNRRGELVTTPLYTLLQATIAHHEPSLLMLDNARHVARINENDGSEVTGAWSLLHGLMRPSTG